MFHLIISAMRPFTLPLWTFWAVILAMLVRAVVPPGYMPDLQSRQTFQLVVCSLEGFKTVTVDAGFDPHQPHKSPHTLSEPCEFSALQHLAVLPVQTVNVVAVKQAVHTPHYSVAQESGRRSAVNLAARPRAPPILLS